MHTRTRIAVCGALVAFAVGCAQNNGDINRVQPNVVKKSDLLDGIWYFRNTVTHTPANTGVTFEGEISKLEKIVFEIQEGNLVGYRAYPFIVGAEANVDANSKVSGTTAKYCDKNGDCHGGQKYYGTPLVAFPIKSHFDIQRGYDPATLETNNVISENTSDRPWNQREYMRVDWAMNELNKSAGISYGATVGNLAGQSGGIGWVQPNENVDDPADLPTFEYDSNNKLTYMDVTGRYIVNPDLYYFEGFGYVPMCWLSITYDCASSEIRMRTSMAKVDVKHSRDYESLVYPLDLQSKFGYFGIDRLNYDRKFGYNDSAVVRVAGRHRIWSEYFKKDASGEPQLDQPIPAPERTPKPIVYYVSAAYRAGGQDVYDRYREPARKLEQGWDKAFRRAAAAAQGKTADEMPQMFVVCDNPVKNGNPEACGKVGFSPKFGDLRYSFVNTISEPVPNGLLGYGPNSTDPETGEIVSATANTYTWGIDTDAQRFLELIDLFNGDTTTKQYVSGQTARDYIAANPNYNTASNQSPLISANPLLSTVTRNSESLGAFAKPSNRIKTTFTALRAAGGLSKGSADPIKVAAETLAQHPELESAVIDNPDFQKDLSSMLPASLAARAEADPAFRRAVARTSLTNIKSLEQLEKARFSALTDGDCHLMSDFYDRTLVGLAFKEVAARESRIAFLTTTENDQCGKARCTPERALVIANDELKDRMRQGVWAATSEHEVGHTLNLYHNFQGSFDAINYFDDYWSLRKETLTVAKSSTDSTAVLPRTPADLRKVADGTTVQLGSGMHDFEYSSIMDYAAKGNGDWKGVGKYDEAAIIFAYSGVTNPATGITEPGYVEVFDSARQTTAKARGSDGAEVTLQGAGLDIPLFNAQHYNVNVRQFTERYHYSTVPLRFADASTSSVLEGAALTAAIDNGLAKMKNRKLMKWSDVKAGRDRLRAIIESGGTPSENDLKNTPLEVPYMFCSDYHTGSVLSCDVFDRGPDYFEITRTKLEDYWNYYLSSHFRRDRASFNGFNTTMVAYNTFSKTANVYKHWVFNLYGDPNASVAVGQSQQKLPTYTFDATFQDYWTMGVLDGINQHLNVMSVPPAGFYMFRNFTTPTGGSCTVDADCGRGICSANKCIVGPRWDVISEGDDYDQLNDDGKQELKNYYSDTRYFNPPASSYMDLPRGLGRRMYSRYDFKSGYGFFNRMLEAGHYNDQFGAMFAAIDSSAYFFGADITSDFNRYQIPYYMVFRPELTNVFGALWANNEDLLRPTVFQKLDDQNKPLPVGGLVQRRFVEGNQIIDGFNYPPPAQTFTNPQKAAPANIQVTWTSRIYALYLGLAGFKVNYDLDYAKNNFIFKLGNGESVTPPAGYHLVEVEDISTGVRYATLEKNGVTNPYSTPALRMIRQAQDYLAIVRDPTICPLPGTLASFACLPASATNNPVQLAQFRNNYLEVFQDQMRDIDLMRGFYSVFGTTF